MEKIPNFSIDDMQDTKELLDKVKEFINSLHDQYPQGWVDSSMIYMGMIALYVTIVDPMEATKIVTEIMNSSLRVAFEIKERIKEKNE